MTTQQTIETITSNNENVDIIRKILGCGGRWQLRIIFLVYLVKIPSSWFMACVIFTAPAPWYGEYLCKPSSLSNISVDKSQILDWNKIVHPEAEDYHKHFIDQCQIYDDARERWQNFTSGIRVDNESESTTKCEEFEFHEDFVTAATTFNLVCDRKWLVPLTQSFHLFGIFLGVLISNELLKNHPPKFVMKLGMVLQVMFGCLTGQVPFVFHCLLRSADAACCVLMFASGGMVFQDITDGKWKLTAMTLFEIFWSIGLIFLSGIGYVFKSWDLIYFAISIPTLFLIPLTEMFIPNSPLWLLKRGHYEEAKAILLESARVNNRQSSIPKDFDELLAKQMNRIKAEPPPAKWTEIWEDTRTSINLACVHLSQTFSIILYYAILLNIAVFGRENLYTTTIVAGLSELIGAFVGYAFVLHTKRLKWQLTGLLNIVGGLLFLIPWIYTFDEADWLEWCLYVMSTMVAKIAISCSLAVMAGCTGDLVTGNRKKTAVYSVLAFSRFWLVFGPMTLAAGVWFGRMVPLSLMGGMTAFNGVLSLLIRPKVPKITQISSIQGVYKMNQIN
ncbi:solute carrier family 22 member 4-like [Culicoides brevitarsis]|uniref:solute carrier family 22 member 4-like n=1 Tax=Culicoides brevitarsis TaxID=469753 RepID=UPI00307BBCED